MAVIAFGIVALVLTWRLSPEDARAVVSAGVQADQELSFVRAGEYVLWVEGPVFTTRFGGLEYELADSGTGQPVPSSRILLRTNQTGLSGRTRINLRRFILPRPGRFRLTVQGIKPGTDYGTIRLSFRPKQTDSGAIPLVVKRLVWIAVILAGLGGFVLSIVTAASGSGLTPPG
jgi:hypothetical protein